MKAWSNDGRRVLYIDKEIRSAKLVGTNAVFVVPGLLTVRLGDKESAELESAFGAIESQALPLVRAFVGGADGEDHRDAVKALIALHFARSFSLKIGYERLQKKALSQLVEDAPDDIALKEAFGNQYGRAPSTRELRDLMAETAENQVRANIVFVQSIQRMYNRTLEYLVPHHLQRAQVVMPHRGELLFSDSPVVITSEAAGTAESPVALMDADLLWFPLSPTVGVSISTEPVDDVALDEAATRKLNGLVWDYAARYLVGRDGAHINRGLGYPDPKIEHPLPET